MEKGEKRGHDVDTLVMERDRGRCSFCFHVGK